MAITVVADQLEDEEHWLAERKNYLTSSAMFTWVGETPDWWQDTREDIIEEKFYGREKVFDQETETSIWHGKYDELNIINKFAYGSGLIACQSHALYINDRWPGIAASIDGFVYPGEGKPQPEASQDRDLMEGIQEYVNIQCDGHWLLEIKKSTSVKWAKECPDYYMAQLQTQLHVLDLPAAVIVADTIKRGEHQKWRWFWDMRAHIVYREHAWEGILDRCNKEFLKEKKGHGE